MKVNISIYRADFKDKDLDGNPLEAFEAICDRLGIECNDEMSEISFTVDTDTVRD